MNLDKTHIRVQKSALQQWKQQEIFILLMEINLKVFEHASLYYQFFFLKIPFDMDDQIQLILSFSKPELRKILRKLHEN